MLQPVFLLHQSHNRSGGTAITVFICMTLYVLFASNGVCDEPMTNATEIPIIDVQPSDEPVLALRYRFYATKRDLKPGAAAPHFTRALAQYLQVSEEARAKWNTFQNDFEDGKFTGSIEAELEPFKECFEHLRVFGEREDLVSDSRWRDLRGPAIWEARLPEAQHSRELARLLKYQAIAQIRKKEFEGAFANVRTGYRLAEFIGQGESVVQKLVGIAIAGLMADVVQTAIATPQCPNLYWALATIPQPLVSVRDAIELELTGVEHVLPILGQSESSSMDQTAWQSLWKSTADDIRRLCADVGYGIDASDKLTAAVAIGLSTGLEDAKSRLKHLGRTTIELKRMPPERILALDTLYEIRRIMSKYGKAYLLPSSVRTDAMANENMELEEFQKQNSHSIAVQVLSIVIPSANRVNHVELRQINSINRLMTLEALRMHAARHDGNLPSSLRELDCVPAIPNPFDGKDYRYRVTNEEKSMVVTLDLEKIPQEPTSLWTLKARFPRK